MQSLCKVGRRAYPTHVVVARMLSRGAPSAACRLSRGFRSTAVAREKLGVEGLASKANLSGQHVLVRLDLNVPLSKEDGKTINNDKRLRAVACSSRSSAAAG